MTNHDSITDLHVYYDLIDYFSRNTSSEPKPIAHPDNSVNKLVEVGASALRKASVLIAVTRHAANNESQLVLTVRSENLNTHAGQISLPGGSQDEQDIDAVATALRESEEEIGLPADKVDVIGQLGDMALPSGFQVTPIVGLIDAGMSFVPCPVEVAEIFHAPLSLVLNTDAYSSSLMRYKNRQRKILELQFGDYRIWGATAAILYHLAKEVADHKAQAAKETIR
jgi:8-oxo-dGTP pyrophosphatase MutT (NUDIX family)